jgi:hypothetical protein
MPATTSSPGSIPLGPPLVRLRRIFDQRGRDKKRRGALHLCTPRMVARARRSFRGCRVADPTRGHCRGRRQVGSQTRHSRHCRAGRARQNPLIARVIPAKLVLAKAGSGNPERPPGRSLSFVPGTACCAPTANKSHTVPLWQRGIPGSCVWRLCQRRAGTSQSRGGGVPQLRSDEPPT